MTNSFHIITAATIIRAAGLNGLANVFVSRPFNRRTVVATLRARGMDAVADMVEARIEMHNELAGV